MRQVAARGLGRFTVHELLLWLSLYPAYLAVRALTISDADTATANATSLIDMERGLSLFHEQWLQDALSSASAFFSTYYMVGFGPLIGAVLVWLGLRDRSRYRELRRLLFLSLAFAVVLYVAYPCAPPRLVPGLDVADTVGLSSHDTGSFAGIKFNPYAAMPSMHVGWSLLVGIVGFRAARRLPLRAFFALHPFVMAVTVTATGNHYFLDSAVGAGIALLAVWLLTSAQRFRPLRFVLRPA